MKKGLLMLLMVASAALLHAESDTLKIFINPGHGGYDSDDRNVTVPPYASGDHNSFWESWSNLDKGLILKELLDNAGQKTMITRTTNTTEDDLPLSQIVQMNNEWDSDFFLSIHSNAGGKANYVLMLYSGITPGDTHTYPTPTPHSEEGRLISTEIAKNLYSNKITCWGNGYSVVGDKTFARTAMTWSDGYGVLRGLTTPGVISEGAMHDYIPETYRLLNHDYRWLEAWHFYKTFMNYMADSTLTVGNIAGSIRDARRPAELPKYDYIKGSRDQYLPINDAEVILTQGEDTMRYTTDNLNNGFFLFHTLTPGSYKLEINKEGYYPYSEEIEVAANATSYSLPNINLVRATPPKVLSIDPKNSTTDSVSCASPITLKFNWDMDTTTTRAAFSITPATQGTIEFSDHNYSMTFTPTEPFLGNTEYRVHLATTATHPDTSVTNNLQEQFESKFLTRSHDRLRLLSCSPNPNDSSIHQNALITLLFDAPIDGSSVNDHIVVKDSKGNIINKNTRSVRNNRIAAPYGSHSFELGETLNPNETYTIYISRMTADQEGLTLRRDTTITFNVHEMEERNLNELIDSEKSSFSYNSETSAGVSSAKATTSSTHIFGRKSNLLKYSFNENLARVEFDLKSPVMVDKDSELKIQMRADFSGNKLKIKLTGPNTCGAQYIEVSTLDNSSWNEYTIPLNIDKELQFTGITIERKEGINSQEGELFIENIYHYKAIGSSVEDIEESGISFWPNPASTLLNIETPTASRIEIIGLDGKIMLTTESGAERSTTTIDLTPLKSGLYLMRVTTSNGSYTYKVVH